MDFVFGIVCRPSNCRNATDDDVNELKSYINVKVISMPRHRQLKEKCASFALTSSNLS